MRHAILLGSLLVFRCAAQEFEVVSVKPSGPKSIRMFSGGPGSSDPGMISWSRATLQDVLYYAYGLQDYEQISGPGWISTEPYDISAKIRPGATKTEFRTMLQNMLAQRFQVKLHHESKDFPVYHLVIARNGPKLKKAGSDSNREGFPPIPQGKPGMTVNFSGNEAHLTARSQPVVELARMLRSTAGRQILDRTGLTEKYDFTLEYAARETTESASLPSVFDALPQQLGLRLEDGRAPFDVLLIDHAEKVPVEN